jgi:hypothetical protein
MSNCTCIDYTQVRGRIENREERMGNKGQGDQVIRDLEIKK